MSIKGEKYTSKKAMKKHEMGEGPAARMKEYGSKTGGMKKAVAKKTAARKMVKK
jgi:hypothetical protein